MTFFESNDLSCFQFFFVRVGRHQASAELPEKLVSPPLSSTSTQIIIYTKPPSNTVSSDVNSLKSKWRVCKLHLSLNI